MRFFTLYLSSLVIFLSSCSSRNDEIIALSKGFFYSLSDSTYANPRDYYPYYELLNIEAESDVVDIDESEIRKIGDTVIVKCLNNYTASDGTFKQDNVMLYLIADKSDQYYICNSEGLVNIDDDLKEYGIAIGAFPTLTLKDRELAERYSTVKVMWLNEYLKVHLMLFEKVKIRHWSWKTSYSGEAHGEGQVVNNLNFAIEGVKYSLKYYDYYGDFMAEDNGAISKILYPGEKYNFTFWSYNAKNPYRANIRLIFPDRLVYKIIKNQLYTGNEYNEYISEYEDNRNKKENEDTGVNI